MFTNSTALWALIGCGLGLFVRSAVVHHAVPAGSPPRRACGACGRLVLPYGTVVLRPLPPTGRCPTCRARLGPPPALPEALTAAALTVTPAWIAPIWCWLAPFGITLALVDLQVHRLPNALTLAAGSGLIVMLTTAAIIHAQPRALVRALLAAAALGAFYLTICLIGGIGMGDSKLAVVLGLALGWLSWQHVILATFATFLLAGTYAAVLLATRRLGRHDPIAFGPSILAGAAAALTIAKTPGPSP